MRQIPVSTLVIDEASQIEIGHYMSIFTEFATTLGKVCFIGDDKQCKIILLFNLWGRTLKPLAVVPPFGENDDESKMQSIFEVAHLRPTTILLDTQCKLIDKYILLHFILNTGRQILTRPDATLFWEVYFRADLRKQVEFVCWAQDQRW
jgi:hypothetical protein